MFINIIYMFDKIFLMFSKNRDSLFFFKLTGKTMFHAFQFKFQNHYSRVKGKLFIAVDHIRVYKIHKINDVIVLLLWNPFC